MCEQQIYGKLNEPPHDKTNKMAYVPSEYSDQPGQQRLRSEWADAQADLSLHLGWAHMPFCWFCHEVAHFQN